MKNIRFAILGTARIARTVGPHIHQAETAALDGIASRDLSKAKDFAAEFDISKVYGSYQEALDDPDVDAVYMPLPPSLHLEWTTKAAKAGKHVLVEKPLARNAEEAWQMLEVCRENNVVLLDGVMWYHTPRAVAMKDVVDSGQLGDLRQMNSVFTFRWDTMPMDNLRMHRELGGGSLLDLGWYCVGSGIWLLGSMPQKVLAKAQWQNDVDIRMNAFLWFEGDRMLTIECGFDTVRRRWFEVAGAKNNLVCDDFTRPWKPEKPRFWVHDDCGAATEHVVSHKPQEQCMVEAFCQLIADKQVDHPWIELSVQTQVVCDALEKSARTDAIVQLSPQA